jgi:hypothetical protein
VDAGVRRADSAWSPRLPSEADVSGLFRAGRLRLLPARRRERKRTHANVEESPSEEP